MLRDLYLSTDIHMWWTEFRHNLTIINVKLCHQKQTASSLTSSLTHHITGKLAD